MERQAIEMNDELMSEEASILASSLFADLELSETESNEIKAGCLGCIWGPPILNHNETVAEDAADEVELEDLLLTAVQEADIKAGCVNCIWGPPILNHNETVAEDAADEDELEDLLLTAVQEADIKAGCLGCVFGPPVLNHNETVGEDEAPPSEALADLPVEDDEQIKGGPVDYFLKLEGVVGESTDDRHRY